MWLYTKKVTIEKIHVVPRASNTPRSTNSRTLRPRLLWWRRYWVIRLSQPCEKYCQCTIDVKGCDTGRLKDGLSQVWMGCPSCAVPILLVNPEGGGGTGSSDSANPVKNTVNVPLMSKAVTQAD